MKKRFRPAFWTPRRPGVETRSLFVAFYFLFWTNDTIFDTWPCGCTYCAACNVHVLLNLRTACLTNGSYPLQSRDLLLNTCSLSLQKALSCSRNGVFCVSFWYFSSFWSVVWSKKHEEVTGMQFNPIFQHFKHSGLAANSCKYDKSKLHLLQSLMMKTSLFTLLLFP